MRWPWKDAWSDVAERLRAPGGPLGDLSVDGCPVRLEPMILYPRQNAAIATADAAGATGLRLRVDRGYVYPIGRALGIQDVTIGDAGFDEKFVIKANDTAFARLWLDEPTRAAIDRADSYQYVVRGGRTMVYLTKLESDVSSLERAVRAVAALASRGRRLLAGWDQLAAAVGGTVRAPDGAWSADGRGGIDVERSGTRITMDVGYGDPDGRLFADKRLFTRVRAPGHTAPFLIFDRRERPRRRSGLQPVEVDGRAFGLRYEIRAQSRSAFASRFPPEVRTLFQNVGPSQAWCDGEEVTLVFPGLITDADHLRQAIQLADALSVRVTGVRSMRKFAPHWEEVARRYRRSGQSGGDLTVDGHPVVLSLEVDEYAAPETRVAADAPGGEALKLRIRRGHVYPLGRALGIQDVRIGDGSFDDQFVVKANDPTFARLWLDAAVLRAVEAAGEYPFDLKGGGAVAQRVGTERDLVLLDAVLRAVAALGRQGARLVAEWTALATALGAEVRGGDPRRFATDGSLGMELEAGRARVAAEPFFGHPDGGRRGARLMTRVRAARTGARTDAFDLAPPEPRPPKRRRGLKAVEYGFFGEDPDALRARLTSKVHGLLAELTAWRVIADGRQVTVWLDGLELDRARLRRAIDLVAALAVEITPPLSPGPYR